MKGMSNYVVKREGGLIRYVGTLNKCCARDSETLYQDDFKKKDECNNIAKIIKPHWVHGHPNTEKNINNNWSKYRKQKITYQAYQETGVSTK